MKRMSVLRTVCCALVFSAASIAYGAVSSGTIDSCVLASSLYAGKSCTVRVTVTAVTGSGDVMVERDSTPSGWTISPTYVKTSMVQGETKTVSFTVTPPAHSTMFADINWIFYHDGVFSNTELANRTYRFTPALPSNTVTAVVGSGGGGTVSPTSIFLAYGGTTTFTITPYSGYSVSNVVGVASGSWGGSSLFSTMTYTTAPVTNDLSLTFNFYAWPDLAVSRLVVTNTSTSGWTNRAYAGDSVKVTSYTKNTGKTTISSGLTSPASKTGFFLSTSATSTNGATYLANDWAPNIPNGSIAIGAEDEGSFTFTVPSDTPPGQYYLLAYADYENNMEEYSETNNLFAYSLTVASKYDLSVSRVSLANENYSGWTNRGYVGQKVKVTSYTKNTGLVKISSGLVSAASKTGFFLSTSATSTNGATYLANDWAPNLGGTMDVGAEDEGAETFSIPNWPAGTYYFLAVADYENSVNEFDEVNNIMAVPFIIVGKPEFTKLEWKDPHDISEGDVATMVVETLNIPIGMVLTFKIYEHDNFLAGGADLIATLTAPVTADGSISLPWTSVWVEDGAGAFEWAMGDPEYYFEVSYADVTATSLKEDGEFLLVRKAGERQTPSPVHGDFYYDPAGVPAGPATADTALTDDRIPLILVHGMGGDGKIETLNYWYGWVNSDPSGEAGYFNTPAMSNKFRVYRYVYDSRDFIETNAMRFAAFVNNFYEENPDWAERQVVIMAHSMGGLVSRYAMNMDETFRHRVQKLVTLGSPHLGSQGANPTWLKDGTAAIGLIYNVTGLHNGTAGCFELAWYEPEQIPPGARSQVSIESLYSYYNRDLLNVSLTNPFTGRPGMRSTTADSKVVLFGGHADGMINDYLSKNWPSVPSNEVKTDHLGLWAAVMIFNGLEYADGTKVGNNDGLVPANSALMTDANAHPLAEKLNLTSLHGEYLDHASYLDVPSTMDYVQDRLLSILKTTIEPAVVRGQARWRMVGGDGHWQKSGVGLGALKAQSYAVEFKPVAGWTAPVATTTTVYNSLSSTIGGPAATYTQHTPSDMTLSATSVREYSPVDTLVGTFSANDPDWEETLAYSLVAGAGANHNAMFQIDENELLVASDTLDSLTFEFLSIRVRVTDSMGNSSDAVFSIAVQPDPNRLPDSTVPVSPVDFAEGVASIEGLMTLSATSLTFDWVADSNALAYDVYAATNLAENPAFYFVERLEGSMLTYAPTNLVSPAMFWCVRPVWPTGAP